MSEKVTLTESGTFYDSYRCDNCNQFAFRKPTLLRQGLGLASTVALGLLVGEVRHGGTHGGDMNT
jgi:hypothetical protein